MFFYFIRLNEHTSIYQPRRVNKRFRSGSAPDRTDPEKAGGKPAVGNGRA